MESSLSIWILLHNVKLVVKILSIFVSFLENLNFIGTTTKDGSVIMKWPAERSQKSHPKPNFLFMSKAYISATFGLND